MLGKLLELSEAEVEFGAFGENGEVLREKDGLRLASVEFSAAVEDRAPRMAFLVESVIVATGEVP